MQMMRQNEYLRTVPVAIIVRVTVPYGTEPRLCRRMMNMPDERERSIASALLTALVCPCRNCTERTVLR